jgi:hypothetical protein
MSKSPPCSWDEVLALGLILPPKSKNTTQSREVQFDIVVTKATRLIRPHKPDMWSVHNSKLAIRAKTARSLTDTSGGYNLETSELPHHSLRPSLLSEPLSPNCPARSHPQYKNINQTFTHQISINPSSS